MDPGRGAPAIPTRPSPGIYLAHAKIGSPAATAKIVVLK